MADLTALTKLLQNPRIAHKESIPVIPTEKKSKTLLIKDSVSIKEDLSELAELTPLEYIKSINNPTLTTLLDKNKLPYIIDNGALMVVKCPHDHIHKLPTRDVADGAKCPTCSNGTSFSRNMVKYIKEEFGLTILYHSDTPMLEYNNPVLKLKIIILARGGQDSFEKRDGILTIRINPKPKKNMLDFLRKILTQYGLIQTQSRKKTIPMTTYGFNRFIIHDAIDINDVDIIDDPHLLFENC
jgi:hypothetical protein